MQVYTESTKTDTKTRKPLKLVKNISYPTYQLYATIENTKTDPKTALKIAILETMAWLRQRFRDLEIPKEIIFPEPDNYDSVNEDAFKSFRINEGYIVDVVYIKECGIWAFHLIEPDLGPDPGNDDLTRKPVPGRVFETNIAYRIYNGKLECGFKTVCSEPVGVTEPCEVYRLAVVKTIVRNKKLGLKQVIPISEEPYVINSVEKIKKIKDYIKNKERQLPLVLIAEHANEIDFGDIANEFLVPNYNFRNNLSALMTVQIDKKPSIPFETETLIKYRMGYAQFAIVPDKYINEFNHCVGLNYTIMNGGVRIVHPIQFGDVNEIFTYSNILSNPENFKKSLEDKLQEYPKFKNIEYGNIKFLNEARIEEQQQIINVSNSKEEIVRAYEKELDSVKQEDSYKMKFMQKEIDKKDKKIDELNKDIESLKKEAQSKFEQMQSDLNKEIEQIQNELKRKDHQLQRPKKTEGIPNWIDKHFSNKLIFHQRAIDMICKTPTFEVDMNLLCDAIEFLACEYRDEVLELISREDRSNICASKYNRPFDVVPSGNMSIDKYPKEYKIKYKIGFNGKPIETALDFHLRVGKDSENLLRIYFLFDNDKKIIVVGSLPKHLNTITG